MNINVLTLLIKNNYRTKRLRKETRVDNVSDSFDCFDES